jgi:hypothetical protein
VFLVSVGGLILLTYFVFIFQMFLMQTTVPSYIQNMQASHVPVRKDIDRKRHANIYASDISSSIHPGKPSLLVKTMHLYKVELDHTASSAAESSPSSFTVFCCPRFGRFTAG